MAEFISILRGINVGGHKKIRMADLKVLYSSLGFTNVVTYIQSGNVLFECATQNPTNLSEMIEQAIFENYGFEVPVLVLTPQKMAGILAQNPFGAEIPIEKLHVTFISQPPNETAINSINMYKYPPDSCYIIGDAAYICCDKYHETKYSNLFFEKHLQTKTTTRNWKTVVALLELSKSNKA